jgi:hypothetical protein
VVVSGLFPLPSSPYGLSTTPSTCLLVPAFPSPTQTRGMGGKVASARLPTIRSESRHERSITGTSDPNTTSEMDSPGPGTRHLSRGESRPLSRTVSVRVLVCVRVCVCECEFVCECVMWVEGRA